jgi:hypothetical protein
MKKNCLIMGILGMALVFGTMFIACTIEASGSIGGGGTGEVRIHNKSSYDIVWVGIWDVAANTWWDFGNVSITNNGTYYTYLPPNDSFYLFWNNVPSGKTYQVRVKRRDSTIMYNSENFTLSQNEVRNVYFYNN